MHIPTLAHHYLLQDSLNVLHESLFRVLEAFRDEWLGEDYLREGFSRGEELTLLKEENASTKEGLGEGIEVLRGWD